MGCSEKDGQVLIINFLLTLESALRTCSHAITWSTDQYRNAKSGTVIKRDTVTVMGLYAKGVKM